MEGILMKELDLKKFERFGGTMGGCISEAGGYHTDKFGDVFVKSNSKQGAKTMFDGEFASLNVIHSTNTIRVPKPIKSISSNGTHYFVAEYLHMGGPTVAAELGRKLALLHSHNSKLLTAKEKGESFVGGVENSVSPVIKFGFDETTCCGFIPLNNEWMEDWVEFYARNRLQVQINMLLEKKGDRELNNLWSELQLKIPLFFKDCGKIVPSLVHGDLWSGNYNYDKDGPVVFDPASFYAHSEFELGIMRMFGGFGSSVYNAYHSLIPSLPGTDKRVLLYELFHHLNHWNHFGSGYRGGTIFLMKSLL